MPFKEIENEKLHLDVLWNLREAVQKKRSEIEGGRGGGGETALTAGFFTTETLPHTALRVLKFLWRNKTSCFYSHLETTTDSFL